MELPNVSQTPKRIPSARPTLDLSALNVITDVLGTSAVNLAANAERRAENLLDCALQFLRQRLESHCSGNFDDLVERDGLAVLDVLLLLAVAGRLLESFDDEGRGGGND